MFALGDSVVYYLSRPGPDMRQGCDALWGEVRRGLGGDPLGGEGGGGGLLSEPYGDRYAHGLRCAVRGGSSWHGP